MHYYSLLSPAILYSILPEVVGCTDSFASTTTSSPSFATAHFTPYIMGASILNVDALAEDCRSRDEEKMMTEDRQNEVVVTNGVGEGVVGKTLHPSANN